MAERNSGTATSHRLEVDSPEQVRNVVLVGPSQSGKTTLVESLLLASGAVNRAGIDRRPQHRVRLRGR